MKIFRNQLKYTIRLRLAMFLKKGIKTCPYSTFYELKKKQQKDNKKINYNLPENAVEAVKRYFGPQVLFDCAYFEQR